MVDDLGAHCETTLAAAALLAPALALGGEAVLQWDPVSNATTYHVQRATGACAAAGLNFVDIGTTPGPATTTYTDKELEEGKDVCYRVAASNPATPNRSPYSNLAGKQVAYTEIKTAPGNARVVK